VTLPRQTRIAALGAVCLGLGMAWIGIVLSPGEVVVPVQSAAHAPALPATTEPLQFTMPPNAAFSEIAARPVFIPTRRPIPLPTAPSAAAAPAPTPQPSPAPPPEIAVTLVGIMIGDKGRFALVRPAGSQTVTMLAQGGEIGGWRVFLILPDRIVLRAGATEAEVAFPVLTPNQPSGMPPITRPAVSPLPQLGQVTPEQPG
jgi:hypothetical protein